jgi:hypothetical protein
MKFLRPAALVALFASLVGCAAETSPSGDATDTDDAEQTALKWPRACEGEQLTREELLSFADAPDKVVGEFTFLGRSRRCENGTCSRWTLGRGMVAMYEERPGASGRYFSEELQLGSSIFLKRRGEIPRIELETIGGGVFGCWAPFESDGLARCGLAKGMNAKPAFQMRSSSFQYVGDLTWRSTPTPGGGPFHVESHMVDARITKKCLEVRVGLKEDNIEVEYVLSGKLSL